MNIQINKDLTATIEGDDYSATIDISVETTKSDNGLDGIYYKEYLDIINYDFTYSELTDINGKCIEFTEIIEKEIKELIESKLNYLNEIINDNF